jgi:hypothetical protein
MYKNKMYFDDNIRWFLQKIIRYRGAFILLTIIKVKKVVLKCMI